MRLSEDGNSVVWEEGDNRSCQQTKIAYGESICNDRIWDLGTCDTCGLDGRYSPCWPFGRKTKGDSNGLD
jgi:hypothetical protein